jgi:hypothetical protein
MAGNNLAVIAKRFNAIVTDDSPGWTNSMLIRSESSSAMYKVAQNVSNGDKMRGQWGCSCLGYIMSAKRNNGVRGCKHLRAMLPALEAAFPSASTSNDAPAAQPVAKRIR